MVLLNHVVAGLAIAAPLVHASPLALYDELLGNNKTQGFDDYSPGLFARTDKNVELRIMPLGASIMEGLKSSTHAGLRRPLREALRNDGWNVNMVGSRNHGDGFKDNDHEAVSGAKLKNVLANFKLGVHFKPNIVLINVGTNNANDNDGVGEAYNLMNDILNEIWTSPDMRNTCVMLSTLLPTNHGTGKAHRLTMNDAYRRLVQDRGVRDGKCIFLADMEPSGPGKNFLGLDQDVWAEDEKGGTVIHPNDEGYRRMAYVFYAAINRAIVADRIKPAADMTASENKFCDKEPGNGGFAANTQTGSGHGDGIYYHNSQGPAVKAEIESPWDRKQWRFARLFNPLYDDLLGWYDYTANDHRFGVWKNSANGQGTFTRIGDLIGNIYCIPRGLHFADVNADGLDDIICISPTGDLHMSLNQGNGNGDKPPSFKYIGLIKSGEGHQDRVRLADIDGDGRVDYGIVADNGHVTFWRNGGNGEKPELWQKLGVRATMAPTQSGLDNLKGLRFEDLNGDGRDDWMYMKGDGSTTTYTNTRSCVKGKEGDGLNVAWRQAFFTGKTSGPTHGGIGYLQPSAQDWQDRIHFARIYGTRPAFGNLGVKDYVYIESTKGTEKAFRFKINVWKNLGSGGTKLEADGNKYCNMHGWDNGRSDYVWVWSDGRMDLFPHAGNKYVSPGKPYWNGFVSEFWKPPGGANVDRRNLHLADWDGDGSCDIIWVDPQRNNRIRVFINKYKRDKKWTFEETAAPDLQCNEKDGIGIHDVAVRFAQITTSGKADYLCISPNGLVRGRMHGPDNGFSDMWQVKFADGADRANLRFADVNGDGKDDLVWVDKFTGSASVWYNEGLESNPAGNSGSHYRWRKSKGDAYSGSYAGTCQYFTDLDGNGRADLHSIMGTWTNKAETWYNPDCGWFDNRGDDDGGVRDPKLPVQPGNPLPMTNPPCTAIRTFTHNRPLDNDVTTIDLWVAGKQVCSERGWDFWASDEDFYEFDCSDDRYPGITWRVGSNAIGRSLSLYTVAESGQVIQRFDVGLQDYKVTDWCSVETDNGCKAKESSNESCGFVEGNCDNGETCSLCDGLAVCQKAP